MLSKNEEFHSATLKPTGHIEVRVDTVVRENDDEISRVPHRHVVAPGDAIEDEDPRVQAIAQATWTPELIAEYRNRRGVK